MMNLDLSYFLKINIAIALFYAFYRLFFYKDTFFVWRRTILLSFLVISLLYPLLNIQQWVSEQEPMVAMADIYATVILPEFEITPSTGVDWRHLIPSASEYIYACVCLLLFFRFCVQLFGIIRLAFRTPTQTIRQVKVHILNKPQGPFSFFKWMFIYPGAHTDEELKEILAHEQTHVRQWHSVDVVFTELMCIVCWFNPFMWLIRREVRNNLEFLADHNVLENGHDSKAYQYHLLGLVHEKKVATLYNSFNVLPLKIRIRMMNKKRTKRIGRIKYAIFLPLAALLLIISNIEAIARSTERVFDQGMPAIAEAQEDLLIEESRTSDSDQNQAPIKSKKPGKENVYEMVEQMPQYPGGTDALMKYVAENLKYPVNAQEKGIQGRIVAQFIVDETGKVTETKVVRSLDPEMDAEAIRVIESMPRWIPGKQDGKDVPVYYTIPIVFSMPKNDTKKNNAAPSTRTVDGETVYEMVDEMPKYPGGTAAMMDFFKKNLKNEAGTKGRVVVQFIVGKDGKAKSPRVVRSLNPTLDQEAIRIVNSMPAWEPGKMNGQAVPVYYTAPISFE